MDTPSSAIEWRLNADSLQPTLTLESLLLDATRSSAVDSNLLKKVVQYHPHLDSQQLQLALSLLSDYHITSSIDGIICWFQKVPLRNTIHPCVFNAVATFLVIPTTTATCERSFSGLRRINGKMQNRKKTIVSHYVKILKNNYLLLLTFLGTNSSWHLDF